MVSSGTVMADSLTQRPSMVRVWRALVKLRPVSELAGSRLWFLSKTFT